MLPAGICSMAAADRGAMRSLMPAALGTLLGLSMLVAQAATANEDFAALARSLEAQRIEHGVPGAVAVLLDREGIRWAAGFGVADRDTGRAMTPDTPTRFGSITKTFTAAAMLRLQETNLLSLDDALDRHLAHPPVYNPWRDTHPVTLAQLLEHTAGLQDWTRAEFDLNDPRPLTLEQGLAFLPGSRTLRWKPGLHAVYSNSGYGIAGLVIERRSGESFETFVARELFAPLRMQGAAFLPDDKLLHKLARGYDSDGRTAIPYWHLIQRPAGALNATPRELAALVRMLLNRGTLDGVQVLSVASVERLETPATSAAAREGLRFGYGLGNYAHTRNGFVFRGHGGDADGYLSHYAYCEELGLGYLLTINAAIPRALRAMRREVEGMLTRARAAGPPPAPMFIERRALERLTGRYELAAWRFPWQTAEELEREAINIRLDRGGFLVTENAGGERQALIPVTGTQFRRGREHVATSAFVEDEGRLYFQEDESWVKTGELESEPANR
jgi:CubicO group peptidase (beta-lactamase class C family)